MFLAFDPYYNDFIVNIFKMSFLFFWWFYFLIILLWLCYFVTLTSLWLLFMCFTLMNLDLCVFLNMIINVSAFPYLNYGCCSFAVLLLVVSLCLILSCTSSAVFTFFSLSSCVPAQGTSQFPVLSAYLWPVSVLVPFCEAPVFWVNFLVFLESGFS